MNGNCNDTNYRTLIKYLKLEPIEAQYFFFNFLLEIDGKYYPKLNANKREKLIKLIAEQCSGFGLNYYRYGDNNFVWCTEAKLFWEGYEYKSENEDFDEALSDLILHLIKNKIIKKEEVKIILSLV